MPIILLPEKHSESPQVLEFCVWDTLRTLLVLVRKTADSAQASVSICIFYIHSYNIQKTHYCDKFSFCQAHMLFKQNKQLEASMLLY